MSRQFGCRSVLDLGNPESSYLQTWAIIQNLVLGSGTLVAFEFGRAELENQFLDKLKDMTGFRLKTAV